jgi:uncharacterized SAM-binding protein YcdF (DUF218 family)
VISIKRTDDPHLARHRETAPYRKPVLKRVLRNTLSIAGAVVGIGLIFVGMTGWPIYGDAREDSLRKADAIVVLGGEHDGREQYGLQLLRDGLAPVLLMSDPYPSTDAAMQRACRTRIENREVLCQRPEETTTRGEAIRARQLAEERGWKTLIIVSWRYHLPRARLTFEGCFSDAPAALIMRGVPRRYDSSLADLEFRYLYQDVGMVKNMLRGSCK